MTHSLLDVIVSAVYANGNGNLGFTLSAVSDSTLPQFEPGAHIDVIAPEIPTRQYSLCGLISQGDTYEICVRLDKNSKGGSLAMHNRVKVGDRLQISAPRNHFPLPKAKRYLLFAGGIGITPLITMMEELVKTKRDVELHYYTSSHDDIAFLERLQSQHLSELVFFHHSSVGDTLRSALPDCLSTPDANTVIMSCGPRGFMAHLKEQVIRIGWLPEQFYRENFQANPVSEKVEKNCFYVQIGSTGQQYLIPDDKSIAAVLIQEGVNVDLSCEQGICGSCLTNIISGIPDHRDSVQSDKEKSLNNQITLCCSRAKSELLILDL